MSISYAQNFEDVLLWRALHSVTDGHYVDVGAHDPDLSSVTRWLYEQGWRGINCEPVDEMFTKLVARRPEDTNLQLLCGDEEGEVTFFEAPGTGLSTMDATHAEELRQTGWEINAYPMPVRTLDTILTEHPLEPLHILKIDVEGAEATVLRGIDLRRWRPWLLVIEATAPLSVELTSMAWEPGVLASGYSKVFFDGLNNYYVADEHPELVPSFNAPANCLDGFSLAPDHVLTDPAVRGLLAEGARNKNLVSDLEEWAKTCEGWARGVEQAHREDLVALAEAQKALSVVETQLTSITTSLTWRLIKPIHLLERGVRSLVRAPMALIKRVVRPAMEAALSIVRRNERLKAAARGIADRYPVIGARLHSFADARPEEDDL